MNRLRNILTGCLIAATAFTSSAFENVDFTSAAEATVNCVVSIKSYTAARQSYGFNDLQMDPFFDFFFGPQQRQRRQQQREQHSEPQLQQSGLGSGVILYTDGTIVTNNHVIEGAEKLEVTLNDNRTFDASVVGSDPVTDLAVLKIDAPDLHAITIGDSDSLKVGEWVLAVGNPFGLTSTVTAGIVSAKARNISSSLGTAQKQGIESYIQTDAAVNPGNSGGALVNLAGELVGINSAIYSQTGNYAGNSFAIPVSIVSKVVDDITKYGSVQRAVLGLQYGQLNAKIAKEKGITSISEGLYVSKILDNTAAAEAGIAEGDVIVAINNQPMANSGQFQEAIAKHRPGDTVTITVWRDKKYLDIPVTLRNTAGNTAVTRVGDVSELGCTFKPVSKEVCAELNIPSGLQVTELKDGKFKQAGIREGFIIVDINNAFIKKADDVRKLYNAIVESDEYDHVMFISGVYPDSPKKRFYAVDLAE